MESKITEQLVLKTIETHTCAICQRIAFPPVRWNVENPTDSNIPKCNHLYCLNCTRSYFQLDLKVSDRREVRSECCVCYQPLNRGSCINGQPKNARDIYYHCNGDEYSIIELLVNLEGERTCDMKSCNFKTSSPEKMRHHLCSDCDFNVLNCQYRKHGCSFHSFRKEIKHHEDNCEYRIIQCLLCNVMLKKVDKISHLSSFHKINNSFDKFLDFFDQSVKISRHNIYTYTNDQTSCVFVDTTLSSNNACVFVDTTLSSNNACVSVQASNSNVDIFSNY